MPVFVDGGLKPTDGITTPEHEAIDHTAGPLSLLDATAHGAIDHQVGVTGVPAPMQSAMFTFTTVTSFNTGALGFTPIAAMLVASDGGTIAIGVFRGTGAANQGTASFTVGLATGRTAGAIAEPGAWTCTQFSSAGIIASGSSQSISLLVVGQ